MRNLSRIPHPCGPSPKSLLIPSKNPPYTTKRAPIIRNIKAMNLIMYIASGGGFNVAFKFPHVAESQAEPWEDEVKSGKGRYYQTYY